MNKTILLSACIAGALLLGACKPTMQSPDTIADRAEKRWQLIMDNNTREAYKYLTPGYRSVVKVDQYEFDVSERLIEWQSVKYIEQKCTTETACNVVMELAYKLKVPMRGVNQPVASKRFMDEVWLRAEDGKWYFSPQNMKNIERAPGAPRP